MATDQNQQLKLINQALAAAKASIDLASQLLGEVRGEAFSNILRRPEATRRPLDSPNLRETPGVIGTFDGENLLTETGQKYKVPENYASKTGLVYGDKLKMVDNPSEVPGGAASGKIFKQIERVKRQRVEGLLSRVEDGSWRLATADASYRVLSAAVKYFGSQVGTEVKGLLPKDNKDVPFVALEGPVKTATEMAGNLPININNERQEKLKEEKTQAMVEEPSPKNPSRRSAVRPASTKKESTKGKIKTATKKI